MYRKGDFNCDYMSLEYTHRFCTNQIHLGNKNANQAVRGVTVYILW